MFAALMEGTAWIVVIGLAVLAFGLITAGLGALIGNILVRFRRKRRGAL